MFETPQELLMSATALSLHKSREQMESDLLAAVQFARRVWIESPENERESARTRFIQALQAFNNLVLYDQEPGE
jgi:hypothetical protein